MLALAAAALSGCQKASPPAPTAAQNSEAAQAANAAGTKASVLDALGKANGLGTFARLAQAGGLTETLGGVADYTLFAPSDAAWARVPEDQRKLLESADGRPQLLAMLRQHIVTGYITRPDLDKALARSGGAVSLATMGGAPLRLHREGSAIIIGPGEAGPKLAGEAIAARNGVIYSIDQVIAPPPAPAATKAGG